jgi:polyvinyl alcohol dehydrogenase (cytochrome)
MMRLGPTVCAVPLTRPILVAAAVILFAPVFGQARQPATDQQPPQDRSAARTTLVATDQLGDRCSGSIKLAGKNSPSWSGWSTDPSNWRFQSAAEARMPDANVPKLKLKWAFGIPNVTSVRSQPAVFRGRVYVGANDGTLYSLDAATGCTSWATTAAKAIRSGVAIGKAGKADAVFFGDAIGDVYAIDAESGKFLWSAHPEEHPAAELTGTPAYFEGRLYIPMSSTEEQFRRRPGYECCTFRGSVTALDAVTGKTVWKTPMGPDTPSPHGKAADGRAILGPSGMAIWSSPTIDRAKRRIYVGTGDNYSEVDSANADAVVALDLDSGKMLWSTQFTKENVYKIECGDPPAAGCAPPKVPEFDLGASPVLVGEPGARVLILGQKTGMVYAVDPDHDGKLLWHQRAGNGGLLGGVQWGMASDGHSVYVAVSDLAFAAGRSPDPSQGGGISAYRVGDGSLLWHTAAPGCGDRRPCSPAQSQAVSAVPGAAFSGSIDGHLRAYGTEDGKIVWDFDTARSFDTVNGVTAKGGSLDVGGPVIANGMVFVVSGYNTVPGNVLLAFSAE